MASAQAIVRKQLTSAAARLPDLFAPGIRLVVGFSGGQDSTCLVHALAHSRVPLEIVAVHVDHGLRAASAVEARAIAEHAIALGAQAEVGHVDIAAYHRALTGWSVQQAARAGRYQALASIARRREAAAVLVAHTADDLVETFLLNLLRGAGLAGLAGMRVDEWLDPLRLGPPLGRLVPEPRPFRLARPLLGLGRPLTLAYCLELGLPIVEDASNQSRAYTRNRVRLDLLPALEAFNPSIRAVVARTAALAAEDVAALDAIVEQLFGGIARRTESDVVEYDLQNWVAQPRALQRRLLRRGLAELLGGLVDVAAAPIEDALDVVQSGQASRAYHLPHGVELRCTASGTFELRLHGRARPRAPQNTWEAQVPRV